MNLKTCIAVLVLAVSQSDAASPWKWEAEPDVRKYAAAVQENGVKVRIEEVKDVFELTFTDASNDKLIHTWKGHRYSSFAATDRFLYIVDYHPGSPGVNILAVDRETGTVAWKKHLPQNEPADNSKFINRTNIEVDAFKLRIYSQQSFRNGHYWWAINARDGKTIESNEN